MKHGHGHRHSARTLQGHGTQQSSEKQDTDTRGHGKYYIYMLKCLY